MDPGRVAGSEASARLSSINQKLDGVHARSGLLSWFSKPKETAAGVPPRSVGARPPKSMDRLGARLSAVLKGALKNQVQLTLPPSNVSLAV